MKIGDCVGRGIFVFVFFFFGSIGAMAQLWVEDFTDEANGATTGTAGGTVGGTWSVTTDPGGTFQKQGNSFQINNTGTEGIWTSNTINIASVGYAIVNVDVLTAGFGFTASDYIRFYYRLDGGPEVLFNDINGSLFSTTTEASAIVAGTTLQLIIKGVDNTGLGIIIFDNPTINAAPIIYSRTSGNWTNAVAGTGTWSLTGHTGASCACYPLNTQVAIIGAGHTVTLSSSQTVVGSPPTTNLAPGAVDVYGILQYTNTATLGIQQGLFRVRSGGTVNSNPVGTTGEQVSFNADLGGATLQVDAGGTMSVEALVVGTNATNFHYLTGAGTLTVTDDILIDAAGATLTNNRSASFTVSGDVDFNGANSAFVNNDAMTISGNILIDANNTSITNNASLTVSVNVDFNGTNSLFVNNAAMTIGDDILMDANNSSFTHNTSSLNVTDDLNFNSTNSVFTNNGTLTFGGDISANNTDDDGNEVINNSGATLSFVNMDGLATGTGAGAYLSILNSGTINQSGTFLDIEANTDAGNDINNLNGAIWNYAGTGHDTDLRLYANNGTNSFNYTRAGAQNIITPVAGNGYSNIGLATSGAKTALASFSVYGNWSRTGTATFAPATYTVSLLGTNAQSITAVGGETFNNLTINNSFGTSPQITLNNAVTVTGTLTMSDGNVNLNGNNFTIGTSAASTGTLSHAGASTNGWMYGGNLIRYMATAATTIGGADQNEGFFPLGSSSDWRPFYIGKSNTGSSGGRITVSHTNSTSTSNVSIADTNPNATIGRRHNSFWTVATSGISAGTWALRAGGTNFGTIQEVADLRMSTSGGVVGTNSAGSGAIADCRVNRTNLTYLQLANNFHVASTDVPNSPLPIELLSFSAQLNNNFVDLKWSTASETNNDYFTVERATDLEHFEPILTHDGQGTSKELNHYKIVDSSPLYGRSYYRLKQTDFDGKFTYSELRTIDYDGPLYAALTVFPNPVVDPTFTIRIEGLKTATHVPVQILNLQGQKVFEKIIEVKTPGIITEEISRDNFPSSGLYIIKAGETLYLTKKIVIE